MPTGSRRSRNIHNRRASTEVPSPLGSHTQQSESSRLFGSTQQNLMNLDLDEEEQQQILRAAKDMKNPFDDSEEDDGNVDVFTRRTSTSSKNGSGSMRNIRGGGGGDNPFTDSDDDEEHLEAGQNTAQSVGSDGHSRAGPFNNTPNPFDDDDDDDDEVNDSGPLTPQDIEDFHDRASNSEGGDGYKGSSSSMQSAGHDDPPGDGALGNGRGEHAQSHVTTNSADTEGTTNASKKYYNLSNQDECNAFMENQTGAGPPRGSEGDVSVSSPLYAPSEESSMNIQTYKTSSSQSWGKGNVLGGDIEDNDGRDTDAAREKSRRRLSDGGSKNSSLLESLTSLMGGGRGDDKNNNDGERYASMQELIDDEKSRSQHQFFDDTGVQRRRRCGCCDGFCNCLCGPKSSKRRKCTIFLLLLLLLGGITVLVLYFLGVLFPSNDENVDSNKNVVPGGANDKGEGNNGTVPIDDGDGFDDGDKVDLTFKFTSSPTSSPTAPSSGGGNMGMGGSSGSPTEVDVDDVFSWSDDNFNSSSSIVPTPSTSNGTLPNNDGVNASSPTPTVHLPSFVPTSLPPIDSLSLEEDKEIGGFEAMSFSYVPTVVPSPSSTFDPLIGPTTAEPTASESPSSNLTGNVDLIVGADVNSTTNVTSISPTPSLTQDPLLLNDTQPVNDTQPEPKLLITIPGNLTLTNVDAPSTTDETSVLIEVLKNTIYDVASEGIEEGMIIKEVIIISINGEDVGGTSSEASGATPGTSPEGEGPEDVSSEVIGAPISDEEFSPTSTLQPDDEIYAEAETTEPSMGIIESTEESISLSPGSNESTPAVIEQFIPTGPTAAAQVSSFTCPEGLQEVIGLPGCCVTDAAYHGDGACDADAPLNTPECAYDGGDCCRLTCNLASPYGCSVEPSEYGPFGFFCIDPSLTDEYINPEECTVADKARIGDGRCDSDEEEGYNTEACNWDGGDCCVATCNDLYGHYPCGSDFEYPYDCKDPTITGISSGMSGLDSSTTTATTLPTSARLLRGSVVNDNKERKLQNITAINATTNTGTPATTFTVEFELVLEESCIDIQDCEDTVNSSVTETNVTSYMDERVTDGSFTTVLQENVNYEYNESVETTGSPGDIELFQGAEIVDGEFGVPEVEVDDGQSDFSDSNTNSSSLVPAVSQAPTLSPGPTSNSTSQAPTSDSTSNGTSNTLEESGPIFCTDDALLCPDGSYVSRDPEDGCNFAPCEGDVEIEKNETIGDISTNVTIVEEQELLSLVLVGDDSEPESAFPLLQCQGDCDDNSDCTGDLECYYRNGTELVPGCTGDGESGKDYCFVSDLVIAGDDSTPESAFPLGRCEGDCDDDDDCAEGLQCFDRDNNEAVPGCAGLGKYGKDYCYADPALVVADDIPNATISFEFNLSATENTPAENETTPELPVPITLDDLSAPFTLSLTMEGEMPLAQYGSSVDICHYGRVVAVGAKDAKNEAGVDTGAVFLYSMDQATNALTLRQVMYGESSKDEFGNAVALSHDGQRLVVGSRSENDQTGAMRVYQLAGDAWVLMGAIYGETPSERAGWAVSISSDGNVVAMASPKGSDGGGTIRTYKYDAEWEQYGSDIEGAPGEAGGYSVSLDSTGSILAVGFPKATNSGLANVGKTVIYSLSEFVWEKIGQEIYGDAESGIDGVSIALSGDGSILVVGGKGRNEIDVVTGEVMTSAGNCRIYQNVDNVEWRLEHSIIGQATSERLGSSVAISPNGNVVGCGGESGVYGDATSGVVRIYNQQTGQESTIWPRGGGGEDYFLDGAMFGSSLALSNNYVLVGAPEYSAYCSALGCTSNDLAGAIEIFGLVQSESDGMEIIEGGLVDEVAPGTVVIADNGNMTSGLVSDEEDSNMIGEVITDEDPSTEEVDENGLVNEVAPGTVIVADYENITAGLGEDDTSMTAAGEFIPEEGISSQEFDEDVLFVNETTNGTAVVVDMNDTMVVGVAEDLGAEEVDLVELVNEVAPGTAVVANDNGATVAGVVEDMPVEGIGAQEFDEDVLFVNETGTVVVADVNDTIVAVGVIENHNITEVNVSTQENGSVNEDEVAPGTTVVADGGATAAGLVDDTSIGMTNQSDMDENALDNGTIADINDTMVVGVAENHTMTEANTNETETVVMPVDESDVGENALDTLPVAADVQITKPACPDTLDQSKDINSESTLYYAVVPDKPDGAGNGIFCGRLERIDSDAGWVGIGFSRDGTMGSSQAVVGIPSVYTVLKYDLVGYDPAVMPSEKQTLEDTSIFNNLGKTIMTFTKLLVETNEVPLVIGKENSFLHAWGGGLLSYHGPEEKIAFKINLSAPIVAPDTIIVAPPDTNMPAVPAFDVGDDSSMPSELVNEGDVGTQEFDDNGLVDEVAPGTVVVANGNDATVVGVVEDMPVEGVSSQEFDEDVIFVNETAPVTVVVAGDEDTIAAGVVDSIMGGDSGMAMELMPVEGTDAQDFNEDALVEEMAPETIVLAENDTAATEVVDDSSVMGGDASLTGNTLDAFAND